MAAIPINKEKNPGIGHVEGYGTLAQNQQVLNEAGRLATLAERDLSFGQAVKAYPRAIIWSFLVSICIVLEGYDVVLIGSMFGQPAFRKKYYPELEDAARWRDPPWPSLGRICNHGTCYASEVCPVALLGYLTVYVNLCWAFGQLIGAGVNEGF